MELLAYQHLQVFTLLIVIDVPTRCSFLELANPSLAAISPTHHGLLHIYTLPATHTLLPPSDKFSTLRGLSSSSTGGSGENNLVFKCMRKRLIFENLHLDLEGGVGG